MYSAKSIFLLVKVSTTPPFSWWCRDSVNPIWAFSCAHIICCKGRILHPTLTNLPNPRPSCWVEIEGFHRAGHPTCHPKLAKLWPPRLPPFPINRAMGPTVDTMKFCVPLLDWQAPHLYVTECHLGYWNPGPYRLLEPWLGESTRIAHGEICLGTRACTHTSEPCLLLDFGRFSIP